MTVLLVLATFLVFVVLDYVMNRGKAIALAPVIATPQTVPAIPGEESKNRACRALRGRSLITGSCRRVSPVRARSGPSGRFLQI